MYVVESACAVGEREMGLLMVSQLHFALNALILGTEFIVMDGCGCVLRK